MNSVGPPPVAGRPDDTTAAAADAEELEVATAQAQLVLGIWANGFLTAAVDGAREVSEAVAAP